MKGVILDLINYVFDLYQSSVSYFVHLFVVLFPSTII